jgi:hypothetical protein
MRLCEDFTIFACVVGMKRRPPAASRCRLEVCAGVTLGDGTIFVARRDSGSSRLPSPNAEMRGRDVFRAVENFRLSTRSPFAKRGVATHRNLILNHALKPATLCNKVAFLPGLDDCQPVLHQFAVDILYFARHKPRGLSGSARLCPSLQSALGSPSQGKPARWSD